MTTIKFLDEDKYLEFINNEDFIAEITEEWNVTLEFNDDEMTVLFLGMSEEEVMYTSICLASCFTDEDIKVIK